MPIYSCLSATAVKSVTLLIHPHFNGILTRDALRFKFLEELFIYLNRLLKGLHYRLRENTPILLVWRVFWGAVNAVRM